MYAVSLDETHAADAKGQWSRRKGLVRGVGGQSSRTRMLEPRRCALIAGIV